ncbi:MAG: NINE protein [Tannerellaceae bacterium]|jgi:TM2 domain-containing membrane protein YozV|nr:NINE protein [Tannerellaceae bacterium]
MKNKTTAAILALFLGDFGIHRFYLGQTGYGLLYLLFCWTLVPLLVSLIDFIIFLTMSEESFDMKYNANVLVKAQSRMQSSPTNAMNNVNVNFGGANTSNQPNSEEIKRLFELKEKGIITNEEFELKKKTLL